MRKIYILIFTLAILLCAAGLRAQQKYTANRNAHSHNDYLQPKPLFTAYENSFGSVEVDIFLINGELYVAHDRSEVDSSKTIESLYIKPIVDLMKRNGGKPYQNGGTLQLLIDLKTAGVPALTVLQKKLMPVKEYFNTRSNPHAVRLVLSGSMPSPEQFGDFDEIFFFDGRPGIKYTPEQLKRIAFFSSPMQRFSRWDGLGTIPLKEEQRIKNFVDSVHVIGKPVRFWGNPDTKQGWKTFIQIGVDYLNTDLPAAMRKFLGRNF